MKPLGKELADLERTDPQVKAAAESYDRMVERQLNPLKPHRMPCEDPSCPAHGEP